MVEIIYLVQIAFLAVDVYMTWQARKALKGMWWVIILMLVGLAIRRVDDFVRNADEIGIALLSSAIVALVSYGIYRVYKERKIFEGYLLARKAREDGLEQMRQKAEAGRTNWDHERFQVNL